MRAKARLDAIVTVVDAKNLPARLDDSAEAAAQIAFADVIVLNKLDLVTPDELAAVEARIRAINRFARIHRATRSDVAVTDILDIGAFDLSRILDVDPDFLEATMHGHSEGVNSVSFEVARRSIRRSSSNGWARCCRRRGRTCCARRAYWPSRARTGASRSRPCT